MNLLTFLGSMLSRLRKDEVMEDLRITAGEFERLVIPAYDEAAKFFKSNKFECKDLQEAIKGFYRNYKGERADKNIIVEIHSRLPNLCKNLDYISEQNEALLSSDILKDGLTAKKAIMVRAAEQMSFISRYAMDFLNYVMVCETLARGEQAERSAPIVEQKIIANIINFARLLTVYGQDPAEFQELLVDLPDVIVNEKNYGALAAVYSSNKIDPLESVVMQGFESNPIYHMRLVVAEWQANRYKVYKDKKRMLELRLLQLKMIDDKNLDPKIEREIEYIQNRVEGLEYKMAKMEHSVQ